MKASGKLQPNDEIEFTITITGPVCDWKALIKQLDQVRSHGWHAWPLSTITEQAREIMDRLDKTYHGTAESK